MKNDGIDHEDDLPFLLLSIKQVHANRIFEGVKQYELRKALPSVKFGRVFLYETGSVGIVGFFDVSEVLHGEVSDLWKQVGEKATTEKRFFAYFGERKKGWAIGIRNAIRFSSALSPKELGKKTGSFRSPQNFLTVQPHTPLHRLLKSNAEAAQAVPTVTLKPIQPDEEELYCQLVTAEISTRYEEITSEFAKATIRTHRAGRDPNGFLTLSKEVLSVRSTEDELLGFTTLTYKAGGSVKTGPTLIFRGFRERGFGKATRAAIELYARAKHQRKIYCTCPDSDARVINYLLGSGLRIEAHLSQHYHGEHGELVLGKLLKAQPAASYECGVPPSSSRRFKPSDVTQLDPKSLASSLHELLAGPFPKIPIRNVRALLARAKDVRSRPLEEKPLRIVPCYVAGALIAAGVLIPKRGGSGKLILLSKSKSQDSLELLLKECEQIAMDLGLRKLYSLQPIVSSTAIDVLRGRGYQLEGVLQAPYCPTCDLLVLSRFL